MSWKKSTIGDVLSVIKNGINCEQNKIPIGDKITRIETIAKKRFDFQRVGYANLTESEKERAKLRIGDILFSHINSPIHVGKTAIYEGEEDIYHGINLLLMRTIDDVNPNFFNHFLNHLFIDGYWENNCKKSVNQASVNQKDIRKVEFNYPSLDTQSKIINKLDAIFTEIDKAKAAAEANAKNAEALFQSYLRQIFDGDGKWTETTLGNSFELYQPQTITTKDLIEDGKYQVYGANGVIGRYDKYNHEESQLLITCRGATCGAVNVSSPFSWINGNAMVVKPKKRDIGVRFTEYFFRGAVDLTKAITGAAQPQITRQSLSPIIFNYPSVATQQEIVEKLDCISDELNKSIKLYQTKGNQLNILKQSVLKKAFNGELVKE